MRQNILLSLMVFSLSISSEIIFKNGDPLIRFHQREYRLMLKELSPKEEARVFKKSKLQ